MKKKDSYFDSVRINDTDTFHKWGNGKYAAISVDDSYNIEFVELDESSDNPCGDSIYRHIGEYRIIGGGIIGYWLAMRKRISQNSQIFRSYLDWEIENHVCIHGQDPDSWKRDLRAEGIDACETFEQAWECAFESFKEYFSESDVSYLTELKKQFLDYLNYCRKHPELPKTLDEARAVIASKDKEIARLREELDKQKDAERKIRANLQAGLDDIFVTGRDSEDHKKDFIDFLLTRPKPTDITKRVNSLIGAQLLNKDKVKRPLYELLNKNDIYSPKESTWNKQVKKD